MTTFRKGPLVNNDLRAIGRYTQKQWSKSQRQLYLGQLAERFTYLAEQPDRGYACDEIRAGYFKYSHKRHVIFFRIANDGVVEFIRVLHQRMDFQLHL